MGGSGYEVGKNYLVYADDQMVKDEILAGFFLYGWTDILREGTHMLVPAPCVPDGETTSAAARASLRQLGKGRIP